MAKRPLPELDPDKLRDAAEQTVSALAVTGITPPRGASSDALKHWHELQVSQIELGMQNLALSEMQQERDQAEAGRDRYAILYEQAPAGYLSLDAEGRITRANHAAAELLRGRRGDLPGKRFEQFVAPDAQATLRRFLAELFVNGVRGVLELPLFDPGSGEGGLAVRQVRVEANLDVAAQCCRVILTDIGTPLMREAARRRAFQVLDNINEGVLVCDIERNIVGVNPAFTRLTGYPVEEALGRDPRFLGRHEAHPVGYHAEAMRCLRSYGRWQGEVHNRRRDGTPYVASMSLTVVRDDDGRISYFIGVFSDITARLRADSDLLRLSRELDARVAACTAELTEAKRLLVLEVAERKRAEAALHESREQLRQLAVDLETVKEAERIRIARDMNELRPAVLDLGLLAAMAWQVAQFQKRSGMACSLALPDEGAALALPEGLAMVLVRGLQEALANIRRHAGATRADVVLALRDGRLIFTVSDNGIGIAPRHRGKADAFGLVGMQQQVAALGGSLVIAPFVQGQGCTLTMVFAL